MRLLRLQKFLVALVLLSFFLCMIVAFAFISDFDILEFLFGDHQRRISRSDEPLFEALFRPKPSNSSLNNFAVAGPSIDHSKPFVFRKPDRFRHRFAQNTSYYKFSSSMETFDDRHSLKPEQTKNKPVQVDNSTNGDDIPVNYNVHVFYYPWYGNPATDGQYLHWNHRFLPHWKPEITALHPTGRHQPPDDIGASFYPRLGPYSSRDPDVIDDHMRQIRRSGAGVLSVSWYPPGLADDEGHNVDGVIPLLLDAADKYSLKLCFHIEPYKNRDHVTLRENLQYITDHYANHSAFYRHSVSRLPIYYIYDSYLVKDEHWKALFHPDGINTVRKTSIDGIYLGLAVERQHPERLIRCGFDGFYTYFATEGFTYGSTSENWPAMAAIAHRSNVMFVPSVGPGYDDVRIRPWNAENSRERHRGAYYERSFSAAVKTAPDIISVTSFNEWHEGSQIEEAVPKKIGDSYTYLDYTPNGSDFYLLLTRKWVAEYADKIRHQTET